jgi:hypothetical protein
LFGSNAPGLKGEVPLSGEFDLHWNPAFSQRVLIAGAPLQAVGVSGRTADEPDSPMPKANQECGQLSSRRPIRLQQPLASLRAS